MKQEITLKIVVEIPEPVSAEKVDETKLKYYYHSESKGKMILVADMHPYHMFNALRKAMNLFGAELILKEGGAFKEMFRRLSEVDPESI